MEGWVKLYRELLGKPIWLKSTPEQKTVLITILLSANHKKSEWEWQGVKFKVNEGEFVTSLDSLVKSCGKGITIQNVRSALKKFESYGFLTNKSTKTGRLISIVNWGDYQCELCEGNKDTNNEVTKEQQRDNNELTPNKNDKNDNNEKKDNIYSEVVEFLNLKANTKYKHTTKKTQTLISARVKEGFTLENFKTVIDIKCRQWMNKDMEKYLRPETLFGTRFEGYLQEGEKANGFNGNNKRTKEEATEEGRVDFSKYEL